VPTRMALLALALADEPEAGLPAGVAGGGA